ncbi:YgaP-like transmembrane domain [Methylobacterium sp. Gmos1]
MANDLLNDVFGGERNLTTKERAISVVLGLGLAAAAAQPRPNKFLSLAALVAGSLLAIRGATGHCAAKSLMNGGSHAPARI